MNLKRALRTVSLYDLIQTNQTVIYYILYHSLVIYINYIYTQFLDQLKEEFPDGYYQFTAIKNNIFLCQKMHLLSLLSVIFVPIIRNLHIKHINNGISESENTKTTNNIRKTIIICFTFINYLFALYQYNTYEREWLVNTPTNNISDALRSFKYSIIILSYFIGIIPTLFLLVVGIMLVVVIIMSIISVYIYERILIVVSIFNKWAKTITCTYVEYSINTNEVEDV